MLIDGAQLTQPDLPLSRPWYERYFCADYWTYAAAEYTERRTAAEVDYLANVLAEHSPAWRVLDLGCGIGRHAVGLAQRGFEVIGLDVSAWALRRARAAARAAGVTVELHRADLLRDRDWRVGTVDAAICVQAFGWGSDDDQSRMLRTLRSMLRPGGLLVLDHSNVSAILRAYQPESLIEVDGTTFHFLRRYDAVTGRSGGELWVRRPDGSQAVYPDDVRLYQPPELSALLGRAGFTVTRVDGEFVARGPVGPDTRYVQFLATVPAAPESALATHRHPPPIGTVDLRWTPDEFELVRDAVEAAWVRVAGSAQRAESAQLAERARRYHLTDPYAANRGAPVLSRHLGCPVEPEQVTAGAGSTGLLRALAGLAGAGPVLAAPDGHPELPAAADALGIPVRFRPLDDPVTAVDEIGRSQPAVTVIDRPAVVGPAPTLGAVRMLVRACADLGGVVVVDETCASYLDPADSAVPLTGQVEGLIVLRSLSKGYCCGGLRVGFAVCSPGLATAVRLVCPPLAVSALPLDVGLALLTAAPDALVPLRARIAEIKPDFEVQLASRGLEVLPTDPRVPWVALPADATSRTQLARCGLAGKDVAVVGTAGLIRLGVPLSVRRRRAVEAALTTLEQR